MPKSSAVGYENNRLILFENHGDCVTYSSRWQYNGVVYRAEVMIYLDDPSGYKLLRSVLREDGTQRNSIEVAFESRLEVAAQSAFSYCAFVRADGSVSR